MVMGSSRDPETGLVRRGTSNTNQRGSAKDRRRRKEWLLETYAADRPLIRLTFDDGREIVDHFVEESLEQCLGYADVVGAETVPTARCYRCGCLLHFDTLTVDRILPGCLGGTYKRGNIRPACAKDNSETGGRLANSKVYEAAKGRTKRKASANGHSD